jgi:hypothetical protein
MSRRSATWGELAFSLIFSLSLAGATLGQGRPAGAGPPPNTNPNIGDRQRQIDESRLRSAEMDAGTEVENQKLIAEAIANMKQDFTRIQVLRNDIARNLVARKPLDFELLSKQTAEINKRSSRLNVYMRAHGDEKQEKETAELKNDEMISALVRLCKLIDSFTENPALKNAATVDAKEVEKTKVDKAKADHDLLAIIQLSQLIQKKSEGLKLSQ